MRAALLGAVIALSAGIAPAGATNAPAHLPRVRPLDARAAAVLAAGRHHSATFRALADELERSDVVVYVYTTPYLSPHLSGGLSFVGASSSWRFLKVALRLDQPPRQMVWILAHELRHAVEVARAADARSLEAFQSLYRHIGVDGVLRDTFETSDAFNAGQQVRREMGASTSDPWSRER